jgi:enoyl-CoA hydratase
MAARELPQFEHLLLERDEALVWMTLNRPNELNAINRPLLGEIFDAFDWLADDKDSRVIIIRGAGRCFSSGYDVSGKAPGEYATEEPGIIEDFVRLRRNIERNLAIWDFPKPVIAAVHGYCLGAVLQLVSVCDITVVADDAKIGFPSMPMGGGYISPFWVQLVGIKRAKQMSFEPDSRISGKMASEWGWANYSVPEAELMDTVRAHALRIAKVPAEVLLMKKMSLNRVADIAGFRASAVLGAETNAILHTVPSVLALRDTVQQHGLKEAIRRFKAGE